MNLEVGRHRFELIQELEGVFLEMGKRIHTTGGQRLEHITPTQYFMMRKLSEGGVIVSEIAEYLGVSLSAVTSLSDRLVKTGLVCRKRDENDRRLVFLELTEKGREVFEDVNMERKKILNIFLESLTDEEIATLAGIYKKSLGFFKKSK